MNVGSYARVAASDGVITLQSSPADLQAFQDFAAMVPKAAAVAQRRAINKTLRWLRTYISRGVSSKERIAVGLFASACGPIRSTAPGRASSGSVSTRLSPAESAAPARTGRVCRWRAGVIRGVLQAGLWKSGGYLDSYRQPPL